jgi:hypothetical protein
MSRILALIAAAVLAFSAPAALSTDTYHDAAGSTDTYHDA